MVVKQIKVFVKPGQMAGYLQSQRVWNRMTRHCAGCLGEFVGASPEERDVVQVSVYWRSRADLDRFMAEEHDRIAALAQSDRHYERIEIRILDDLLESADAPPASSENDTLEAGRLRTICEAYRGSAALRSAVRLALFDRLRDTSATTEALCLQTAADPLAMRHLLHALAAMGLVERAGDRWRNAPVAQRLLVSSEPTYQGEMVLHETQPVYLRRAFAIGTSLGLPEDDVPCEAFHERFLKVMAATAAAGQADILTNAVDLSDCRTLLDVGGAKGVYSIPLCRKYGSLSAVILDQAETTSLAEPLLNASGLGERIRIQVHDYRAGPFPGPVDAILISNVLRGETGGAVADMLRRAREALDPGGRLIVTDLFVDDARTDAGLRAAWFGLHIPTGANMSLEEMAAAVENAGFTDVFSRRFDECVVMNGLVEARTSSS